jgi:hypothetical protein
MRGLSCFSIDCIAYYKTIFPELRADGGRIEIGRQHLNMFNGGPHFKFSEGISLAESAFEIASRNEIKLSVSVLTSMRPCGVLSLRGANAPKHACLCA